MNFKLAIFSPSVSSYSETFIQEHRRLNNGNIAFYHGPMNNICLDGKGPLITYSYKLFYRFIGDYLVNKELFDIKRALNKSFKREKVNSILIEYGTYAVDLMSVIDLTKFNTIVHFHGYDASVYKVLDQNKEKYIKLFNAVNYVIAVSKEMEHKLLEIGCPRNKLVYNVYGPSEKFYQIEPHFQNQNFISIGRFVDKKAPYYLIYSMQKVVEKYPLSTIIIVGDGMLMSSCENIVKLLKLEKNVFLVGKKTPFEIKELLNNAVALIQHSITAKDGDKEGTPLSILEGMASSLPIISTFHAGISDVVEHAVNGYLVKEHDYTTMADHMCEILSDLEKAKKMGALGKEKIVNKFSLERHLNCLDKLFQNKTEI
jgi:glycosyltransferase involved in cell wall biosynthesis